MRRPLVGFAALIFVLSACTTGTVPTETIPDEDLISVGASLYSANCASCHGEDLRGTDFGPSHLSEVYVPSHHGDEAFQRAVVLGVQQHHWNFGRMPPVPGLDRDQVSAIVAFVRDIQEKEGFEPYPP